MSLPGYIPFGISGAIYVVGFDRSFQSLQGEVSQGGESRINEISSGAAVDYSRGVDDLVVY